MMRTLSVAVALALSGCLYGDVESGEPFINCSSHDECPYDFTCAAISSVPEPGARSGFGLPGGPNHGDSIDDVPEDEPPFWFHGQEERRFYPYCAAPNETLRCDNAGCMDGMSAEEAFCIYVPGDPETRCLAKPFVHEECPDGPCPNGWDCVLVLEFGDDEYIGGHRCAELPAI